VKGAHGRDFAAGEAQCPGQVTAVVSAHWTIAP
jgi:hypothetical protein